MQRQLGELTFSEYTAASRDAEATMRGGATPASVGPEIVTVGLFYGELTRGSDAGTRVLIKAYSSEVNNQLAAARAAAPLSSDGDRMRERLQVLTATPQSDAPSSAVGGADASRQALEQSLSSDGTSMAELLSQNEFAAHSRIQAIIKSDSDVERQGLGRMLARMVPEFVSGEPAG